MTKKWTTTIQTQVDVSDAAAEKTTTAETAQSALNAAISRFKARNKRSEKLQYDASQSLPGGNTRSQLFTPPFPVFMRSGRGYQLTSEDDHVYTDLVGDSTASLYGHSHHVIQDAINEVLCDIGTNLGATHCHEQVYARALCARFSMERVRFTNSGTEANLFALAAARAFTQKRRVVVTSGSYHGGVLLFADGVPAACNVDQDEWIVARFNDVEGVVSAIRQPNVAAVLVEAMQGGPPAISASAKFLEAIEATAKEANVLFILDEVMTSRFTPGGAASFCGVHPDLKTMGKYLGGGFAFGAFGGRADVMSVYDPRPGPTQGLIPHHGTFNNNLMTLYVGHSGLMNIYTPKVAREFHQTGETLRHRLKELTKGTKMCFTGMSTVLGSHFTDSGLQELERDAEEDWVLKELFWLEMMEEGFWTARRGFIALTLDTPQTELDRFVRCVEAWLEKHRAIVQVAGKED